MYKLRHNNDDIMAEKHQRGTGLQRVRPVPQAAQRAPADRPEKGKHPDPQPKVVHQVKKEATRTGSWARRLFPYRLGLFTLRRIRNGGRPRWHVLDGPYGRILSRLAQHDVAVYESGGINVWRIGSGCICCGGNESAA